MVSILVIGAGKSSAALIQYLLSVAENRNWRIIVADSSETSALNKINHHPSGTAVTLDIQNSEERLNWIKKAALVISLLPPQLHAIVASDCVNEGKHFLTASYVDDTLRSLAKTAAEKGVLLLSEMGLDPGIDHMSAMKIIDAIKQKGGNIISFVSHCGGLVAPENDDNPWHYKISWNPRNVVTAGQTGAAYLENSLEKHIPYKDLFSVSSLVTVPGLAPLAFYPNRDSLSYIHLYALEHCAYFLRTTLRYPEFMYGWNMLVALLFTSENIIYNTRSLTIKQFFHQHLTAVEFDKWLLYYIPSYAAAVKSYLFHPELSSAVDMKTYLEEHQTKFVESSIKETDNKDEVNTTPIDEYHKASLIIEQLMYLGMHDDTTLIDRDHCNAASILQFCLEQKLVLQPNEKDMIVMLHQITYEWRHTKYLVESSLVVKGEDAIHTAMAKTVGLPLGIAAKLILEGSIVCRGLQIPIIREIYEPVLEELIAHQICFQESETIIN